MKNFKFIICAFASTTAFAQTPPQIVAQPSTTPYTVFTPSGTYIVVPNYSTNQPQAVIQVGRTVNTTNSTTSKSSGAKTK